jgi:hypothetical protein
MVATVRRRPRPLRDEGATVAEARAIIRADGFTVD